MCTSVGLSGPDSGVVKRCRRRCSTNCRRYPSAGSILTHSSSLRLVPTLSLLSRSTIGNCLAMLNKSNALQAVRVAQQEMDSSSSPAFAVAPPRQQQCVRQADEQHQKRLQICGPAARPPGVGTPTEKEGGRPGLTAAKSRFIPNQARSSLFAPSFQPSPRQVMLNKSNALQVVRVSQQEMDPASSPTKAAETRGSPEDGSSGEKGASAERAVSEPFGRRCHQLQA